MRASEALYSGLRARARRRPTVLLRREERRLVAALRLRTSPGDLARLGAVRTVLQARGLGR
jgi:hypothetical protein